MVNRDTLIDYLLHDMPEPERLDFAERWFSDRDLSQQLETAEAELLDAYVRGELPRPRRERVDRYLLTSYAQRRKLAFAAALHGVLPVRRRRQIPWMAICAAALLVLLTGVEMQNRGLRGDIAKLRQDVHPLPGGTYSASLGSSLRGSQAATVSLPKEATMLRLDLDSGEEHEAFSATLSATLSNRGRTVWQEQPLSAHNGVVTMWIPTQILDSGNYTVAVASGGKPVAYYPLRITTARPAP